MRQGRGSFNMTANFLGLGGLFCQLKNFTRTISHRVISLSTVTAVVANSAAASAQVALPAYNPGGAGQAAPFEVVQEDEEYSGQVDAIHSPNVESIVKPQYKLDVAQRHSQLMVTRRNMRRIQVTDSRIVNYVQFSPTELSIVGQQLGTTNLSLWFQGETTPSIYKVTVVRDENIEDQRRIDFGRLERRLAVMFPNSNVYLTPIGTQIHLRGQAYDAEEAAHILQIVRAEVIQSYGRYSDLYSQSGLSNNGGAGGGGGGGGFNGIIVNDLSIPGAYNIMLRVIIAEINRSQQRDANIDLNVALNNGRHLVNTAMGAVATGTNFGGIYENGEIQSAIHWLQTTGTISLLAEPTLVTMSGHAASLLGGGEFAVPTIIGVGGGQTTSFRGVGTSMVVTPTVIDHDLMRLQVQAEHSAISAGNTVNGIPGTTAKRVQTTVELREGQTLAIGGLTSRQTTTSVTRIPLLGDIPYLGTRLFQSKTSSEGDTELLILVTPEIVNAMQSDEVPPLPNFYVTHPNDHDLYRYARTEGHPDLNVYQSQPYGSGSTDGIPVGYNLFNPPVNGPSFQPRAQGGFSGMQSTHTLIPQPDHALPPAHSMQQYQQAPPAIYSPPAMQNPVAPRAPMRQMTVPQPRSPLPPVPVPVPVQVPFHNVAQESPIRLADRFNNLFKSKKPAQTNPPVSTTGWQR